jgi:AraC-like DNA-binding protein
MTRLVRADDVPATSRVDYWRHVVDETLGPLDLQLSSGPDLRDELLIGDAGAVRVARLSTPTAGGANRRSKHIRRSDPELCTIDVLARGRVVVAQDGRQALLGLGDFAVVDLSRPVQWTTPGMQTVAVVFPRALLPLRPDQLAGLTAVRFPGDQGTGALASSLARQLVGRLDDWGATDGARLGGAVLDLFAVALAARLDREEQVPAGTHQRVLLLRVQAFIEARLGDPWLSPEAIAAAHYISPRSLYKLFEAEGPGWGVAGWIRQRRLERCRRDLLDPTLAGRPVSTIAARWGLTNAAHFSRAFRAAYGVAPVEYRRLGDRSGRP